jgi:hypothetical protein
MEKTSSSEASISSAVPGVPCILRSSKSVFMFCQINRVRALQFQFLGSTLILLPHLSLDLPSGIFHLGEIIKTFVSISVLLHRCHIFRLSHFSPFCRLNR